MKSNIKVGIGTKFRYTHADGNPEWTVIKARGRGTWECEVLDDVDWTGTKKVFSSEEIAGSIGMSNYWKKTSDDSDVFYSKLTPGSIVHYHNGFNQFVRCQVTSDHQLLPIAMVGNWQAHDLPRRMNNGEIGLGYHAEQIKYKRTFHPHASNVYEFSHRIDAKDPRQMVPWTLEVPPMTEAERIEADKYKLLKSIRDIVESDSSPDVIFGLLKRLLLSN